MKNINSQRAVRAAYALHEIFEYWEGAEPGAKSLCKKVRETEVVIVPYIHYVLECLSKDGLVKISKVSNRARLTELGIKLLDRYF